MSVPCGKCDSCLANKRKEWFVRCAIELKHAQNAWFVTLTYDDEHLVWSNDIPTLSKVDVQLFLKRLRKLIGTKIKYYAVGEYGSNFERPHYHVLFFNLLNDQNATQKILEKAWSVKGPNGEKSLIGHIHCEPVNPARINYTLKYLIQNYKDDLEREKPFSLMSKRPPIGSDYYAKEEQIKYHKSDLDNTSIMVDGVRYPLPRLYKEKIFDKGERQFIASKNLDRAVKKKCEQLKKEGDKHPSLERDRIERFRARFKKSKLNKGRNEAF